MRENGVQVRLSYSAVPENCGDMQKIFELSKKLDAHIKGTTYMYPKMRADGGSAGTNSGRLSADQAAEYRIKWNKIRLSGDQYESSLRSLSPEDGECALMPEGEGVRCRAGRSSFWVNWRGEMSACGVMPYKAVSIKENGFDKCWELVKASTEKIRLPKECAVCGLRSVCNVCAAVCYCETGGFDRVPEYVCRLTHETARLAAKELAENTKKESGI